MKGRACTEIPPQSFISLRRLSTMRAKETLQLRHQLACSGLSIRAATYDTKRHHVLTYDSHPLRPHMLRLFSLRREIKSVDLFDKTEEGKPDAGSAMQTAENANAEKKRLSYCQQQIQQQQQKLPPDSHMVVTSVTLIYASKLDVYICVYASATPPIRSTGSIATTYSVLLIEPASLRKLLLYSGPATHRLKCSHYDHWSERLLLASHLEMEDTVDVKMNGSAQMETQERLLGGQRNVVELLQISKRLEDGDTSWVASSIQEQQQQQQKPPQRTLLCIEKVHAVQRHPESLELICGSRGLRELYGAVGPAPAKQNSDNGTAATTGTGSEGMLLEWRLNQPDDGKFVLARRVALREAITAMALSPCRDWLLVGLCKGGLKVWNVNGSRTNGSALYAIDAAPYEPTGDANIPTAQAEILSSIEISAVSETSHSDSAGSATKSAEAMVITAERDTGTVRHWRLTVEERVSQGELDASNTLKHRLPVLELVGSFKTSEESKAKKTEKSRRRERKRALEPTLKTLVMCVNVNMGSCMENLLIVLREDVMHVLKVQTVLHVIHEFAAIEEVYSVRAITQRDESKVLCLSGAAASNLRVFPLGHRAAGANGVSPPVQQLLIPPLGSSHIIAVESIVSGGKQTPFVVLAWSNGMVDVYDVSQCKRVVALHDSQLRDQISALSAITFQRSNGNGGTVAHTDDATGSSLLPPSWGGLLKCQTTKLTARTNSDGESDAVGEARQLLVVVGTESGKLFGWKVGGLWVDSFTCRSIHDANVRVQAAHSTHIIQLAHANIEPGRERDVLTSVGADGIVKLWSVPSLTMVGFVSSATADHAGVPSCIEVVSGRVGGGEAEKREGTAAFVSVGYEDGRLAAWRVDTRRIAFQELEVGARHERRVSKICGVSTDQGSTGETEFLSCSLDMTVIQWQILGSGTVQEKRYFDIGGAVVDMVLVEEQAVVALAHEVCMFVFAPHSICATKYAAIGGDSQSAAQREISTEYPDTPTTRSIEDPTETLPSSRHTARSVDEYLTLHVPSMLPQPESASASSIPEQNSSGSVFALSTNDDDDGGSSRRHKAADAKPGSNQAHATSDNNQTKSRPSKFTRPSIDEKELRGYVEEYISRHGTDGTMAAGRLTDLLALKPELPTVKRRGFALAKCLQELKVNASTRVDVGEASWILTALFAAATVSRPAFDGATAAHCGKQNQLQNGQVRMQKAHEREQTRRKYVISYNILGEKYIRWEEAEEEQAHAAQSPSLTSSIGYRVVRTPKSPPMRELTDPVAVTQSDESIFSFSQPLRTKESDDVSAAAPLTKEGEFDISGFQEDSDMISPRAAWKANGNDIFSEEHSSKGDDGATAATGITPVERNDEDRGKPAKKIKKVRHKKVVADGIVAVTRVDDYLPENGLVCSMKLSRMFREFWSKGYCWCEPAPKLHVLWKDQQGVDDHGDEPLDEKHGHEEHPRFHGPTCELCRKRLHTVELPRRGYVPHFSRRATLAIILEVYSKLTASAHMHLYKKSASLVEGSSELSIFGALFEVFKTKYGMRRAVEAKLKLFFVSMCHFLRDHDAVAVFGELLGLHTPDDAVEHEHIPSDLVALIVCCYSWLYSREMVVRGNGFPGISRGDERGRHDSAVIAGNEAHPMAHGKSHWQFVQLGNALLCAQENLLYPLVSPAFLRNVLLFIEEYAQRKPTQPKRMDAEEPGGDIGSGDNSLNGVGTETPALWIELHRFLRLLVGEWKHQNAEFRAAEQFFFAQPPPEVVAESELFEKLRLLLSCFVFYDHERVGVMAISDFESLLIKLRYLWPNEQVTADEAARAITAKDVSISFENAIFALRKRFVDLDCDGQLCYLDFWAMLYVVGIRTRTLVKFREMPSFCRDYKLEIPPELRDMLLKYMHASCMLLLPTGLQVGTSSLDHKAERQHRRRVGGLHDGVFNLSKTLGQSLSTQELLANGGDAGRLDLFLDGAAPAIRQSASVTALDRYRPLTVDSDLSGDRTDGALRHGGREPKVVGVRPIGPTPKPIASLSVSMLDQCSLSSNWAETNRVAITVGKSNFPTSESDVRARALERNDPNGDEPTMTYASMYIQFPLVPPSRRRVGAGARGEEMSYPATQIVGYISPDDSSESGEDEDEWDDPLLRAQLSNSKITMGQEKEEQHAEMSPTRRPPLTRVPSLRSIVSMEDEVASVDLTPRSSTAAADQLKSPPRGSSLEKFVVVPSIDKVVSISPANARTETLRRQSSRDGHRVGFLRIRGDETDSQSQDPILPSPSSRHASVPIIPVVMPREATPPDTRGGDNNNGDSGDNGSNDSNDNEARHDQDVELPGAAAGSVLDLSGGGTQVVDDAALGLTVVGEPEVRATSVQEAAEDNDSNDSSEGSDMLEQALISPAVGEKTESDQAEVVATMPAPIEDPVAVEEPADEVATSDLSEITEESQYPSATPLPVMKESNPLVHHTFRFSRQPAFLDSVAANNNPFRAAMWNPSDDTDSDGEDADRQDISECDHEKNREASRNGEEEEVGSGDCTTGKESPANERHSSNTVQNITASFPKASVTSKSTTNPMLRRAPSQSHLRSTLEPRGPGHMESTIDEESDASPIPASSPLPKPPGRVRLNEDAERALYGGQVLNALGEGIAFSAETEAAMQQKWQQFFDESESNMFSSLRRVLEKKQLDQREAEERQSKLRKKWQEQQDQDLQRLQQSRHNSAIMLASGSTSSTAAAASFRLQRIHRESCSQLNEELQYGVTVQGECHQAKAARHFHFHYFPEAHGSIITLKMHVTRGDAEVFMSTETKVPCVTDFMWRSVQKLAQEPSDAQEGQKIMLYPHDLLRVVTAAAANAASSEQVAADLKANANTLSLRSFSQAKLTGESPLRAIFYLSVVALEPDTTFTLAIMTSGQKMQPSRAIQTVDYLIDRFNTLSRSFQGPPTVDVASVPSYPGISQAAGSTRNLRNRRTPLDGSDDESTSDDSDNAAEAAVAEEKVGEEGRKRLTLAHGQQNPADQADTQELSSFQHLLETLSEKNGFEPPRSTSFLLSGPSEEHFEFVQDEELRLREAQQQFSPPKDVDGSRAGRQDAISVVTERRLTLQGKRQKLRRVVSARLQKRLAPLHHHSQRASQGDEVYPSGVSQALETKPSPRTLTNLRVAKFAPRPVAYSLTSLESLPHGHRLAKSRTAPFLQPHPRHNVARSNESKRKPDEEEATKKT
ncbi:hypothetical protein BBJ28_00015923 [Nothophytophthora sp. Chile5]|nr:hypothetical protein BBJ28_00015923 [Nothophytophthora sp. Chile5]